MVLKKFQCNRHRQNQHITGYFYVSTSLTMVNGVGLESIKLKEAVFDGHIANKVESLHCPHSTDSILLLRQVPGLRSP